jgi:hypothetical protein
LEEKTTVFGSGLCIFEPYAKNLIEKNQFIERKGMPAEGWIVNVRTNSCDCLIMAKNGSCVHLTAAKIVARIPFPGSERVLVDQTGTRDNKH